MDEVQQGVYDFHRKYGCAIGNKPTIPSAEVLLLRARLIEEEAAEFLKAASLKDIVGMADAIGDILYVVYGTAVVMGIDMQPISREIQASNMTKDGGGIDSGGKVMKGPDFVEPNIALKLQEQGLILND